MCILASSLLILIYPKKTFAFGPLPKQTPPLVIPRAKKSPGVPSRVMAPVSYPPGLSRVSKCSSPTCTFSSPVLSTRPSLILPLVIMEENLTLTAPIWFVLLLCVFHVVLTASVQRGNPIGGLVYSNAFPTFEGNNKTFNQVIDWSEQVFASLLVSHSLTWMYYRFIGGNAFCMTICNPFSSSANQSLYCENRYDLIGCAYNQPSNVQQGVFEICDSALKQPVGIYTSGGATLTWTQPNTGPVTPPYTEPIPSSSNCRTYASTDLYPSLPTPTTNVSATATGATRTGSGGASVPTSTSNGASALGISPIVGILGTLVALTFLS